MYTIPIKTEKMMLRKSAFVGPARAAPFTLAQTLLISVVESKTCLGVKINTTLSWLVYISSVKKHFTQKVGALKRIRVLLKKSLEEIYFKAIIPRVTYGHSVWRKSHPSAFNSLNSIHTRATRR